jgi:hypothetical protein
MPARHHIGRKVMRNKFKASRPEAARKRRKAKAKRMNKAKKSA